MSNDIDLSVAPYYDDFDETKNYHKILYKPSVPVQVRELNQVQTIFQNQIERFADNVLTRGTIVEGCAFSYYDYYPYVKIKDLQLDGEPVDIGAYPNLFARNSANLVSYILTANTGFESQDPDLNTLFVRYVNSGNTGNLSSYSAADVLTLYDANVSIWQVNVPAGGVGTGFSNTDPVSFLSAMVVDVSSTNTFSNGELVTQVTTGAKAQIVEVNSTAIAGSLVLKVAPRSVDVTNTSLTTAAWTFNTGLNINSNTTNSVANVTQVIGSGATGLVSTDGIGKIQLVVMTDGGSGYDVPPFTVVKPASASADVTNLALLAAQNYKCQLTVASVANSVGSGFAFGVGPGVIYQKGMFLRVNPQVVVVSKYSSAPDQLVVGFDSTESIVDSTMDSTLSDPVSGDSSQAPGADRLKVEPSLVVLSAADAAGNADFYPITGFSLGQPFLQNRTTAYSVLGDEMARRTKETSGDFVLDPFLMATKSASDPTDQATEFRVLVDPGHAYISGHRIRTFTNDAVPVRQGTDLVSSPGTVVSLNYGSYVVVKELGGIFQFTTGDVVSLRSAAGSFLSNSANTILPIANVGSQLGTARARSLELVSGTSGSPDAQYRLYLFDVNMAQGQNFRSVRSIVYNGSSYSGIADVVTGTDPTTGAAVATLQDAGNSRMAFGIGVAAVASTSNSSFQYRKISSATANTQGKLTVTLTGTETHPYVAPSSLGSTAMQDVILVPAANGTSANLTGSFNLSTSSNVVSVSGGTVSSLSPGDWVMGWTNSTSSDVRRITATVNSTAVQVDRVWSAANTTSNLAIFFPTDVPVPVWNRSGRTISVDASGQVLTVDLGVSLVANVAAQVVHSVLVSTASPVTKTSNRNSLVKLNLANNSAGTKGPWPLGVPDIYRLKGVFMSSNVSTVNVNSQDVTNQFYIDHAQNPDYYDVGYLFLKPRSSLALTNTSALLVEFDNFTVSANGFAVRDSYQTNDSLSWANLQLGTSINTLEIPEMHDSTGHDWDLIETVDFRPYVANTANVTSNVSLVTINPSASAPATRFGNTADPTAVRRFPIPGSAFVSDVVSYAGRVDRVVVGADGLIRSLEGKPDIRTLAPPPQPTASMTVNLVYVPAYPSIPTQKANDLASILDKKIANELYSNRRVAEHTVTVPSLSEADVARFQPVGYTMENIAELDRRIQALEYYQELSLLEANLSSMAIPSSVSPTINRFKFGYLADNFSSTGYTDVANPEYEASFLNQEVVPRHHLTNLEFDFNLANVATAAAVSGRLLALPWSDYVLVQQLSATSNATPVANVVHPPAVRYHGTLTAGAVAVGVIAVVPTTPASTNSGGGTGGGAFGGGKTPVNMGAGTHLDVK